MFCVSNGQKASVGLGEQHPLLNEDAKAANLWARGTLPGHLVMALYALIAFLVLLSTWCVLSGAKMLWIAAGNAWYPPVHPECPVPVAMRWCRTRAGFDLACLDRDIVCDQICTWGFWEFGSVSELGFSEPPIGDVVDVGANVGWYSLLFAQAGYRVHAFEAMHRNVALLKASLCANPQLAGKVFVNEVALAATPRGVCQIYSSSRNVGDGAMCCPGDSCTYAENPVYRKQADVPTSTLDAELAKVGFSGSTSIGFIKLDVEGYECEVLQGAKRTLAQNAPQYLMSEIWAKEIGCTPAAYLALLRAHGYSLSLGRSSAFEGNAIDTAELASVMIRSSGPRNLFAKKALGSSTDKHLSTYEGPSALFVSPNERARSM